jgi:hypothetical protein
MFDSGITAFEIIDQVKKEADIAVQIPDESYMIWLNAVEQLLYSEVIKEQGVVVIEGNTSDTIDLSALEINESENEVRFEDIHAVYADDVQLIRSTAASGVIFKNTYYKCGDKLCVNTEGTDIKIVYFAKPKLKTTDNYDSVNVMLPHEFVDIVKAKLRAEAYKVANEGDLAAVWMNDYNVLLETFKAWVAGKAPQFGV